MQLSTNLTQEEIKDLVAIVYDDAVNLRRLFHENPELGFEEYHTLSVIKKYLTDLGIEVKTGIAKTGLVGILHGKEKGPVIALRADMDALPIQENTGTSFASKKSGVMHACGHDMHMAMLLGAANALSQVREKISGTIKFIFQPAEEMLAGGKRMVEEDVLKNPDVDYIYGFHVWPELPIGQFGFKSGALMASMDSFEVSLKGKASHGAAPHQGIDAIVGSAQVITGLQSIISRETDPLDSVVITIGELKSGNGFNIVPESAVFKGTVRTINKESRQRVSQDFKRIIEGMANALRLEAKINYKSGYPITNNTEEFVDHASRLAEKLFGQNAVVHLEKPSMASEDFSFYLEHVPGAFIFLGVQDQAGGSHKLHNERFLPDEKAMKYGIGLFIALATNPFGTRGQAPSPTLN
ncbi:M20 metallopeptidase family protein [Oceanobacillus zhaokaii]|uniref:M20 metallopeptidase family protein n=1 Tax=Oceanobacillus zhaokaii TaxID=2052660 RepID=UPI001FA87A48|nr:M20 family metallopeptidase [Oceanobacillus zhaokaii]